MGKFRIGIIGLGMGKNHVAWITQGSKEVEVAGVADLKPERLEAVKSLGVRGYADYKELVEKEKPEGMLVATPHDSHPPICMDLLKRGLPVLSEKPIAIRPADADRVVEAVKKAKLPFGVMYQFRFSPVWMRVKEILESRELGAPLSYHWVNTSWFRTAAYFASDAWRGTWKGEGGGILLNQSPHDIDLLQWLFGKPERVSAAVRNRLPTTQIDNEAHALLTYPSGMTGYFFTTHTAVPPISRTEIFCESGSIVVDNALRLTIVRAAQNVDEFARTSPKRMAGPDCAPPETRELPLGEGQSLHVLLTEEFARAVREKREPKVTAESARDSLEIGCAILMAGTLGTTVKLPVDRKAFDELHRGLCEGKKRIPGQSR
jgi:predicted dehydrogenase